MVVGLLSIVAIPTVTGVGQAVSAQKRQNAAAKEKEQFNMTVLLPDDNGNFQERGFCLLQDGKMVLSMPDTPATGHKFCGFYFKYPGEEGHMGLVSTISNETPMLNWIYVDRDTHAVRFGTRKDTSTSGFIAKRESRKGTESWVVYLDRDDTTQVDRDTAVPCRLRRRPLLGVESTYVKDKDKE